VFPKQGATALFFSSKESLNVRVFDHTAEYKQRCEPNASLFVRKFNSRVFALRFAASREVHIHFSNSRVVRIVLSPLGPASGDVAFLYGLSEDCRGLYLHGNEQTASLATVEAAEAKRAAGTKPWNVFQQVVAAAHRTEFSQRTQVEDLSRFSYKECSRPPVQHFWAAMTLSEKSSWAAYAHALASNPQEKVRYFECHISLTVFLGVCA
jgi:hypothetical protein